MAEDPGPPVLGLGISRWAQRKFRSGPISSPHKTLAFLEETPSKKLQINFTIDFGLRSYRQCLRENSLAPTPPSFSGTMLEKIATVVKSAGIAVESYWPNLFAKFVEKRSIQD
ncbi:hypothetical protein Droror1_Dr00004827 [Drosera rotundifolia]